MSLENASHFPASPHLDARIESEVRLPGAHIQLVNFSWTNRARIFTPTAETTIQWRVTPGPVAMTAGIGEGAQRPVGRLMVRKRGDTWLWTGAARPESIQVLQCFLGQSWLEAELAHEAPLVANTLPSCPDLREADIDATMRGITAELARRDDYSASLLRCHLTTLALQLARRARTSDQGDGWSRRSTVEEIENVIRSSERTLRTSEIARKLGMSTRHMRRIFKEGTGRTLQEVIEDDRLRRAYQLLGDSNLQLKMVSYLLGYGDQSTFSHAFKRATGMTPLEFRKIGAHKQSISDPAGIRRH
ncbi:MAG: helix-turn-helix transcriptional regulator [Sphingomonadaceae bacterium]